MHKQESLRVIVTYVYVLGIEKLAIQIQRVAPHNNKVPQQNVIKIQ